MSSDEPNGTPGQFRGLGKPWRDPKITKFLGVFDAAYVRLRAPPGQAVTRGPMPGRRVTTTAMSKEGPAVRGLPVNVYDASWYARRTALEKQELQVDPAIHSLAIDAQFLQ